MGADIHLHTEVKIKSIGWRNYSQPDIERNYRLFYKMAGIRGPHRYITPIKRPVGLPMDVSVVVKLHYEKWESDAHDASFLNSQEIVELEEWLDRDSNKFMAALNTFGPFFGNNFSDWVNHPEDELVPEEIEDIRFTFWFDN